MAQFGETRDFGKKVFGQDFKESAFVHEGAFEIGSQWEID